MYSGSVESNGATGEVLESLFRKFNLEFPADHRSLSCPSPVLQARLVVTIDIDGLAVDWHFGSWHSMNTKQISGKDFYPMEHDEYGDEAASIIVDATGKLVAEDLWDEFSPEIVEMIAQERGLHAASEDYLAASEDYSEENYNQIDGRMDTQSKRSPGDDTESQPEKQPNGRFGKSFAVAFSENDFERRDNTRTGKLRARFAL